MSSAASSVVMPAPAGPLPEFLASESPRSGPADCPWPVSPAIGIVTPRLQLRPFTTADHAALHRIMVQPETFAYSDFPAPAPEETWARLLRHIGHWSVMGYGMFAVELRETGEVIGEVGLADFHRGFSADFDNAPEAAWTIDPAHWGKGFAEEGARAAHIWLSRDRAFETTVCMIHPDNDRSLRVATKLGYAAFAEVYHRGQPVVLMRRTCPDAAYQRLLNSRWAKCGRGRLPVLDT